MKLCGSCGAAFRDEACQACSWKPEAIEGFPCFAPELARGSSGFRPELFEQLAALEPGNFWFRARNLMIVDAMARYFPDASNMLEIGCGTGYVLGGIRASFPRIRLSGSEISIEGLRHASRRVAGEALLQMDARAIPFQDEFDVIGAFDVIEHIPEDERVLAEIWKALAPGGGVLITVPQHPALWSVQDEVACHQRRYRRGEMEGKLRDAGFDVLMTTSFVSLLLPLLAISRLRKKNPPEDYDPASELKLPNFANSVLFAILLFERRLIRIGVRFPAGGTRLIVARKGPSK
jgi:SAM-dependent methyltransferase